MATEDETTSGSLTDRILDSYGEALSQAEGFDSEAVKKILRTARSASRPKADDILNVIREQDALS